MPRMGRVVLANYPHHVVQRGHNRQVVFASEEDFSYYLDTLAEFKEDFRVKVYGFCLMTNHVHLLLQPSEEVAGLGRLMKRLEGRSGTLWESRYRSSVVDSDEYLLACKRYIELNPVRAGMVDDAGEYPWSSYGHYVGTTVLDWMDEDPCYHALDESREGRQAAYRDFVGQGVPAKQGALISQAVQRGQLTGGARFAEQIEGIIGARIENRGPGRPRKTENE